ncbi:MAG: HPP family protein, partial [Gammaproteobacteria bacterium]
MPIINPNFKRAKKTYLFKCVVVLIVMLIVLTNLQLISMNAILGAIGASSLASSIFICFALPRSPAAEPRRMIGSYVIGILIGIIFYYIATYLMNVYSSLSTGIVYEITGSLAVAITMFLMVFFSLEHPPAAGMALGIVIDPWRDETLLVIIVAIILIAIAKEFLRPWLLTDSP